MQTNYKVPLKPKTLARVTVFQLVAVSGTTINNIVTHLSKFSLLSMQWSSYGGVEVCLEDWRGHYRISFGVSTIITQFGLPFLCSLLVYVKILHTLRDRTRTRLASSVHLTRRREQRKRNRSGGKFFSNSQCSKY